MAEGRGGLLSAGGILSIIVGAFEIIIGGTIVALRRISIPFPRTIPGFEGVWGVAAVPIWLIIAGGVLAVLGIVAIVGGISAVRRGRFGLSLAGAICAFLLAFNVLGILAVIFVSLGKREVE